MKKSSLFTTEELEVFSTQNTITAQSLIRSLSNFADADVIHDVSLNIMNTTLLDIERCVNFDTVNELAKQYVFFSQHIKKYSNSCDAQLIGLIKPLLVKDINFSLDLMQSIYTNSNDQYLVNSFKEIDSHMANYQLTLEELSTEYQELYLKLKKEVYIKYISNSINRFFHNYLYRKNLNRVKSSFLAMAADIEVDLNSITTSVGEEVYNFAYIESNKVIGKN